MDRRRSADGKEAAPKQPLVKGSPVNCKAEQKQSEDHVQDKLCVAKECSVYARIGQSFQKLRKERGFTRRQMAEYLGWDSSIYKSVENGGVISVYLLHEASEKLDVSLDWLVGRSQG